MSRILVESTSSVFGKGEFVLGNTRNTSHRINDTGTKIHAIGLDRQGGRTVLVVGPDYNIQDIAHLGRRGSKTPSVAMVAATIDGPKYLRLTMLPNKK